MFFYFIFIKAEGLKTQQIVNILIDSDLPDLSVSLSSLLRCVQLSPKIKVLPDT